MAQLPISQCPHPQLWRTSLQDSTPHLSTVNRLTEQQSDPSLDLIRRAAASSGLSLGSLSWTASPADAVKMS